MATVGAGHIVVAAQGCAGAGRGGFLADARMQRAADLSVFVEGDGPLLEPADQRHGPVQVKQCGGGKFHQILLDKGC